MTGTERFEHRVWKFCIVVSSDVLYRFIMYIVDFNKPIMKNGIGVMFVWKKKDPPVKREVIKYWRVCTRLLWSDSSIGPI